MRHARELTLERRAALGCGVWSPSSPPALLVAASLTAVAVNRSREAERRSDEAMVARAHRRRALEPQHRSRAERPPRPARRDRSASLGVSRAGRDGRGPALGDAGGRRRIPGHAMGLRRSRAGPFGIRGVFDLPLSELADTARARCHSNAQAASSASASSDSSTCPPLPSAFPAGLATGVHGAYSRVQTDQPLVGTQVTLYAGNDQDRVSALRREFEAFTAETGIEVRLVGNPNFPDYVAHEPRGRAIRPTSPSLRQPGYVRDLARGGSLIDLGTYLDLERLKEDQSPYLVSLGTIGDDGSWPASDGATYGAFVTLGLKSMIWYPVPEFGAEGYAIPQTWDELVELERSTGSRRPHAMVHGVEVGAPPTGGPGPTGSRTCCSPRPAGPRSTTSGRSTRCRSTARRCGGPSSASGRSCSPRDTSPTGPSEVGSGMRSSPWSSEAPRDAGSTSSPISRGVCTAAGGRSGSTTDFFPFPTIGPPRPGR